MIFAGGDVVTNEFVRKFDEIMEKHGAPARLCRGYGLTEMCAVCTNNSHFAYSRDSVGYPLVGVEVEIWDDDCNKLPAGTVGEIVFSGDTMMNRYLPDDVIQGAKIFIESSRNNSVIPCIKHYPGHGDADSDSHLTLPKISLSMKEMEEQHIKPFKVLIENSIEMVMVAHLHCTCFDKEILPTSLSQNAVGYLRNQLGYNGVVITDDMVMKAVQDFGSLEACIMAIKAGVDMFIFREADDKTLKIIEDLALVVEKDDELKTKIIESNERILKLKKLYGILHLKRNSI